MTTERRLAKIKSFLTRHSVANPHTGERWYSLSQEDHDVILRLATLPPTHAMMEKVAGMPKQRIEVQEAAQVKPSAPPSSGELAVIQKELDKANAALSWMTTARTNLVEENKKLRSRLYAATTDQISTAIKNSDAQDVP